MVGTTKDTVVAALAGAMVEARYQDVRGAQAGRLVPLVQVAAEATVPVAAQAAQRARRAAEVQAPTVAVAVAAVASYPDQRLRLLMSGPQQVVMAAQGA
tara:strand:- start:4968 stop:5264 length:297 start_codon:yes stop_codon:yes gene_type:complete